jgi:hypothetical protein
MNLKRLVAASASIAAVAFVAALYTTHAAKSSDHQDTYNLATRSNTSADITDVYVFPSPSNPNNVVFAMDVMPLIFPAKASTSFFDPTVIWQFKIAHGATNYKEDQVIQISAGAVNGSSQSMTLYGPAAPNEVGTVNTLVGQPVTSTTLGGSSTFANGTGQFFAGTRTDPFVFDLFAFFTFLGDRNFGTHTSQSDPGPETAGALYNGDSQGIPNTYAPAYDKSALPTHASFNGFASGTMSTSSGGNGGALGAYACSTNPATDDLFLGPFDVLSLVVEVPKSMISGSPYNTSTIHVWATANSSTGS